MRSLKINAPAVNWNETTNIEDKALKRRQLAAVRSSLRKPSFYARIVAWLNADVL